MLRWVVLVVGGCSFQLSPGSAVIDAPVSDALDEGIDADVDAMIDAPPGPLDADGDGVLDAADNCPARGNADQHNEDGDPRGDVCDPCPYLANVTLEADGDADGIGDACDPHPATTDLVVLFDPFKTAGALSSTWVRSAGSSSWSISGDALRVAVGTSTEVIRYPTTSSTHTIDLGVTVEAATGGGGVQNFVTGVTDLVDDLGEYFGCGYRFDNPATREFFAYQESANPQFSPLGSSAANPPTVPGTYRIRLETDPGSQSCMLGGTMLSSGNDANGNTSVGIRARNVTLVISYVAIYRTP